jgi:hypothetical protein
MLFSSFYTEKTATFFAAVLLTYKHFQFCDFATNLLQSTTLPFSPSYLPISQKASFSQPFRFDLNGVFRIFIIVSSFAILHYMQSKEK